MGFWVAGLCVVGFCVVGFCVVGFCVVGFCDVGFCKTASSAGAVNCAGDMAWGDGCCGQAYAITKLLNRYRQRKPDRSIFTNASSIEIAAVLG